MEKQKKVIFIIKDGWGYRKEKKLNAIASASTPHTEFLNKNYPSTIISASGEAVGLPKGFQGNSEVGHLTIGSGRIIKQSLVKINSAIKNRSFFRKKELLDAVDNCKRNKSSLHVIGLLQKEGVHAHVDHLYAILDFCKRKKVEDVCIHVITDGRDSPVNRGEKYIKELNSKIKEIGLGRVVTISGRYYAMDRDKRWERTKKAYRAIVEGSAAENFENPLSMIRKCYKEEETDEFIIPKTRKGYTGIKENDSVIFYNFRIDRPRQLTKAMIEKDFNAWKRKPLKIFFVAMTDYYKPMNGKAIFKEEEIKRLLGDVLSKKNIRQLRISETEKYAHVTFFLNGQNEKPFKGEDRALIPSPKVSTYNLVPEMSAEKIAKKTISEINKEKYQFIVVNLVNADMVGHTADKEAIIKAVETVDSKTDEIVKEGLKKKYSVFIFADHGNAEDQRDDWKTSHTVNPVEITVVDEDLKEKKLNKRGGLRDVAPTVLDIMGIKKPKEMTGNSLINW